MVRDQTALPKRTGVTRQPQACPVGMIGPLFMDSDFPPEHDIRIRPELDNWLRIRPIYGKYTGNGFDGIRKLPSSNLPSIMTESSIHPVVKFNDGDKIV